MQLNNTHAKAMNLVYRLIKPEDKNALRFKKKMFL